MKTNKKTGKKTAAKAVKRASKKEIATTKGGRQLRAAREAKGQDQGIAATKCGMSQAQISAIESKGQVPKLRGALAIHKVYGVELHAFLS